jgi:hypothetical protein
MKKFIRWFFESPPDEFYPLVWALLVIALIIAVTLKY